jgi:hypothetical protein
MRRTTGRESLVAHERIVFVSLPCFDLRLRRRARHEPQHASLEIRGSARPDRFFQRTAERTVERDALAARLALREVIVDLQRRRRIELPVDVRAEKARYARAT